MRKKIDLLAAYWTLSGGEDPRVANHVSPFDFRKKAEAASKAGFTGIGFWHTDLEHLLQSWTLSDLKQVMDDHGLVHIELEFLMDWYKQGEEKRRSDHYRRLLLEAAEVFGARHVKVGDLFRTPCPMDRLIESFAELCVEAAQHGTRIGYEMMPFSTIDSLESAITLVEGANQPNGGIFFDFWHVAKLGIPFPAVAALPPERIIGIELNDGFAQSMADLVIETTDYRQLCGEGDWDVKGFIKTMQKAGYDQPWGVEILSKSLRALPLEKMAHRAFATTMAQFPS